MKKVTPVKSRRARVAVSTQGPAGATPERLIVVGIGASAGGLEALEEFFREVRPLEFCAFVVVQHLSATQPSLLPQLLQRKTTLPVQGIKDGVQTRAGHVYVAPAGVEVTLASGALKLNAMPESHLLGLPIDLFFRSLAADKQGDAVGVILSGMGSDGTLGLRSLKEREGATFVQSPESAQFDSMPRSAIQAGVVDAHAEPAALPSRIAAYLGHVQRAAVAREEGLDATALESIVAILRALVGHDFSMYKKSTVQRRIERRMALHHKHSVREYEEFLRDNKAETELLFKELLIGVTSFFRDPAAWEQLKLELVPQMLARHPEGGTVRIWVPACSTGEEVYSLAMVFAEVIEALRPTRRLALKIFATDIDADAIDRARAARYPANIAVDVSAERLARFFVVTESGYMLRRELRENVVFALQNVAMDPPFTKLDMLVCRNLLIYFEPALQRKLLPLFHYSLEPGGVLMLGSAETVGASTEYFMPLPGKSRFFRKVGSFRSAGFVAFPATFDRPTRTSHGMGRGLSELTDPKLNLQSMADHVLLQRYSPAAVLVTPGGDVLYINGRTGKYLEPAAGKANWNVFAMAREGLGQALSAAFREAVQRNEIVSVQAVIIDADARREVRMTIDPLTTPKQMSGMVMIVFVDGEEASSRAALVDSNGGAGGVRGEVHRELDLALDALRAARGDAQNADEQSRAANEELQSANEELQSTNEELTTSKEEMQSMNEELQTVNQELQAKLDELSQASDDMRNLLNSTDIATLFLDESLRVRRFTLQIVTLFKLIASDVGRPITDIANDLKDWKVADDARAVLGNLVYQEKEVAASGERWFKVRTMPYRTSQNRIDGVVITFSDVTKAKLLELQLRDAKAALETRLDPPVAARAPRAKRARKVVE